MKLFSSDSRVDQRKLLLLAPTSADPRLFSNIVTDPLTHHRRLAEAQKLRGKVFMEVGAVGPAQLSGDGCHIQAADERSWHLLTLDSDGCVGACARYLPHGRVVRFDDLAVSRTALAKSATWGEVLRNAVEADLQEAKRRSCSYVELGGWAISQALRCTTEALRTMASAYAFAQLCGGGLGITTANTRSCSAAILKRAGCERLQHGGTDLPIYYDEQYHNELEILRFDVLAPNPRYRQWIDACRSYLRNVPVICREAAEPREQFAAYRRPLAMSLQPIPTLAAS